MNFLCRGIVTIHIFCTYSHLLQTNHEIDDLLKYDCRMSGCLNEGKCQKVEEVVVSRQGGREMKRSWMKCACPISWVGPRCEKEISTKMPRYHGDGYTKLHGLPSTAFHRLEVTLEFKPETGNGLILIGTRGPLSGDSMKDFFALSLVDGSPSFRFDCGSGVTEVKPSEKIGRNEWNVIVIGRANKIGYLRLNDGEERRSRSRGSHSKISLDREFFLGGHPNVTSLEKWLGTKHGMVGCVRRLFIDGKRMDLRKGDGYRGDAVEGLNVESCSRVKEESCQNLSCRNGGSCVYDDVINDITCWCPLGFIGSYCQTAQAVWPVPRFLSNSYMRFSNPLSNPNSMTIEMTFKPELDRGLLFYLGISLSRRGDFIMMILDEGFVRISFNLGDGTTHLRSKMSLKLNQWHKVYLLREAKKVDLIVDDSIVSSVTAGGSYLQMTLNSRSDLYIGGHPFPDEMHKDIFEDESFFGCIRSVVFENKSLSFTGEAIDGRNVERCGNVCSYGACGHESNCIEEENGNFTCI